MPLFKRRNNNTSLADSIKKKTTGKIHYEKVFRSIIERERARADRTDHKFSLIVLDLRSPDENHQTTNYILQKIFRRVRKIDEIGWYDQNRIGIILPYTSAQGAQKFAESLSNSFGRPIKECLLNIYTYDSDQTHPNVAKTGRHQSQNAHRNF